MAFNLSWMNQDWQKNLHPAGDWALQESARPRMVLGKDDHIVWPDGEPFYIVGDTGHGKSTLAQNIVRASIGLLPSVLTFEFPQQFQKVLYVAADRPPQIKYSLKRMIPEHDREVWNDHVKVWEGQLPFDIGREPLALAEMTTDQGADAVVLDSLKDLAANLNDDEAGANIALALRTVLANGTQLLITHHPRKAPSAPRQSGNKPIPPKQPTMDDVYGSFKFTGSAGSVWFINPTGDKGIKELVHLKAAAGLLPTILMAIHHETGMVSAVNKF